ncbi:UPF0158 family protein [Schwartzia sp. (in: firmicutes)]
MKIKLHELADAFAVSETHTGYVDLEKGKILLSTSSISEKADADNFEQDDEAQMDQSIMWEEDWQRYVVIPNLGDYDFRELFGDFISSKHVDDDLRSRLQEVYDQNMREPYCKKLMKEMKLTAEWEAFLHKYFMKVAREWCEENMIDFE